MAPVLLCRSATLALHNVASSDSARGAARHIFARENEQGVGCQRYSRTGQAATASAEKQRRQTLAAIFGLRTRSLPCADRTHWLRAGNACVPAAPFSMLVYEGAAAVPYLC